MGSYLYQKRPDEQSVSHAHRSTRALAHDVPPNSLHMITKFDNINSTLFFARYRERRRNISSNEGNAIVTPGDGCVRKGMLGESTI